jgi:hypothetical protein
MTINIDYAHPQVGDTYSTLLPALVNALQALASFNRTDNFTETNQPAGSLRLNTSGYAAPEFESWSGSAWSRYALNYLSLSTGGTVAGTVNFSGTLQTGGAAVATQSYVAAQLGSYAPLASPALTGSPTIGGAAIATQSYVSSNYAPLTGAGASGTWGINITGNCAGTAGSASTAAGLTGNSPLLGNNWQIDANYQLRNNGATMDICFLSQAASISSGNEITFSAAPYYNGGSISRNGAGRLSLANPGLYEVTVDFGVGGTTNQAPSYYFNIVSGTGNVYGPVSSFPVLVPNLGGNGATSTVSMRAIVYVNTGPVVLQVLTTVALTSPYYIVQNGASMVVQRVG